MTPKISVIIPVYNVEKYLHQCLDSVINQTLNDIEIICINDGSTDSSLEILKDYKKKDKRIIVIDQKNAGQSVARNAGLDIAKSNYILFIDSDDWIELDTLKNLYDVMMSENVDIVMSRFEVVAENQTDSGNINRFKAYYASLEKSEGKHKFKGEFTAYRSSPCCKLFKKQIIDQHKLRFPTGLINEDEAWHWYYFANVKNLYYLNKVHYNRRMRDDSTMSNLNKLSIGALDALSILECVYDYLIKNNIYTKYHKQYTQWFESIKKIVLTRIGSNDELRKKTDEKIKYLDSKIEIKKTFFKRLFCCK